ncbi:MAG TPA: hypothetical protein VG347_22350 [Verrucomicrobiae bacterium]|nr:hypothetical protein [Verrucomicrobiae bacterium]
MIRMPEPSCWQDVVMPDRTAKFLLYNFGQIVWGVFARAFWPIYTPGKNNHYGSVVFGFDPFFKDTPALFEMTEDLRTLRENGGEPKHLKKFASQIRNDSFPTPNRVRIPPELAGERKAYFQSIYIPRPSLPGGYLHSRLVPIIVHPMCSYAILMPVKFWPEKFKAKWLEGKPPLDSQALADYRRSFPNVEP